MAINIDTNTDGDVTYQNPPVNRVLFPNITYGATPEEIQEAVDAWLDDHPEATTTIQDGSILPVKLDSSNDAADGYVLSWNATDEQFEWVNVQADINDLKQDLSNIHDVEAGSTNYNDSIKVSLGWIVGGIDSSNGIPNSSSSWLHTELLSFNGNNDIYVSGMDSSHRFRICTYSASGEYESYSDYYADILVRIESNKKYRFMVVNPSPNIIFRLVHSKSWINEHGYKGNVCIYLNKVINASTGIAEANSGYACTGFVYVDDVTVITSTSFRNVIGYNQNKEFVKLIEASAVNSIKSIDVSGVAYIRASIPKNETSLGNFFVGFYRSTWSKLQCVLFGKALISYGDSLMYGHYSGLGIADGFAEKYHMEYTKHAVNGAKVVGTGTDSIYNQLNNANDDLYYYCPKVIIFDGFTNDAGSASLPNMGNLVVPANETDITAASYDTSTFYGSAENILRVICTKYPVNALALYITPHKMCTRAWANQQALYTAMIECCAKWSVPVVDVFNKGVINTYIGSMREKYSYDNSGETSGGNGTHLTGEAYDKFFMPMIEQVIETHVNTIE